MAEHSDFEARVRDLLIDDASAVDRPFDPGAIARRAAARPEGLLSRVVAALSQPGKRVARAALPLAMMAALLGLSAFVGSRSSPDPAELVRRSQAVHRDPPPFRMTTTVYDIPGDGSSFHSCHSDWADEETLMEMEMSYAYDGAGRFRQACRSTGTVAGLEAADAWIVVTPEGQGTWTGSSWMEETGYGYRADAPLATVEWLNWVDVGPFVPPLADAACDWRLDGQERVAGRDAWMVSCDAHRLWIDSDSLLILKRVHEGTVISEVLDIELGAAPPADLFALGPPPDARQRLEVGQVPVAWTLPTVDGRTLAWSSQLGRPTVVLLRAGCPSGCLTLDTFVESLLPRLDEVNALVYADAGQGSPPGNAPSIATRLGLLKGELAAAAAAGIPVVVDDGSEAPAWDHFGGVMAFDERGRLLAERMPFRRASLDSMVDSLLAGLPIPTPGSEEALFAVGAPAPPLETTLLEGTTFELAEATASRVAVLAASAVDEAATVSLLGAFADACGAAEQRPVCLVIPGVPPYGAAPDWAALRDRVAAAGHPIEHVGIVMLPPGEAYWSSLLRWGLSDASQDPGDRRAVVIVGGEGTVESLVLDPALDGEELTRLVSEATKRS